MYLVDTNIPSMGPSRGEGDAALNDWLDARSGIGRRVLPTSPSRQQWPRATSRISPATCAISPRSPSLRSTRSRHCPDDLWASAVRDSRRLSRIFWKEATGKAVSHPDRRVLRRMRVTCRRLGCVRPSRRPPPPGPGTGAGSAECGRQTVSGGAWRSRTDRAVANERAAAPSRSDARPGRPTTRRRPATSAASASTCAGRWRGRCQAAPDPGCPDPTAPRPEQTAVRHKTGERRNEPGPDGSGPDTRGCRNTG